MAKCSACEGKGYVKCPVCDGEGRKWVSTLLSGYYEECGHCNGSGIKKCGVCNGKGYID